MNSGTRLEENPAEACAAILRCLYAENDLVKRDLLLADFANKVAVLPPEVGDPLRGLALESCLPGRDKNPAVGAKIRASSRLKVVDVAITTVTPLEWRAVTALFDVDESTVEIHNGRQYYELSLPSKAMGRNLKVVITSIMRPLNVPATKAMFEIQRYFQADIYFLLGIAAGRPPKVSQGDVVIPEEVHYYEPGRQLPRKKEPRPAHKAVREDIQRAISYYEPSEDGFFTSLQAAIKGFAARDIPVDMDESYKPQVVSSNAVIASGEKLIQDGMLQKIHERHDERVMAGDEEAFGFAEGVGERPWMIFRGISDYGEDPKPNDWQYVAVFAAGLALKDYLESSFRLPMQF